MDIIKNTAAGGAGGGLVGGAMSWLYFKMKTDYNEKSVKVLFQKLDKLTDKVQKSETETVRKFVTKEDHQRLEDRMDENFREVNRNIDKVPSRILDMMKGKK